MEDSLGWSKSSVSPNSWSYWPLSRVLRIYLSQQRKDWADPKSWLKSFI